MRQSRNPNRWWRVLRAALGGLAALYLVRFHVGLLWERLAGDGVFGPGAALRWSAALVLALGAAVAWRAGIPFWRGRPAIVFWLLVLLLHAGAMVPVAEQASEQLALLEEAGLLFAMPLAALVLALLAAAARWWLARHLSSRPSCGRPPARLAAPAGFATALGFARRRSSLPPPALA